MAVACLCFYVIKKLDATSSSVVFASVEEILESFSAIVTLIACRLAAVVSLVIFGQEDVSIEYLSLVHQFLGGFLIRLYSVFASLYLQNLKLDLDCKEHSIYAASRQLPIYSRQSIRSAIPKPWINAICF